MFTAPIDAEKFGVFIQLNSSINADYSDPHLLLERIVEAATRLTDAEASSLLLLDEKNQRLYFEIALGPRGPEVQRLSLDISEGIAGWVFSNNVGVIVNDPEADERFYREIGKKVDFETRRLMAVPLRLGERCIGVIEVINKTDGGKFSVEDLQWLEVFANQAALAIQHARSLDKVRKRVDSLEAQVSGGRPLVYRSHAMTESLSMATRIAGTDSSVLILGESGVGKELFAEFIHGHSLRREGPLVRVNCAALPEQLLESELFGHVRGAYTDAVRDRRGRFELADGGTIFLDEVGELPLSVQAKMLRILQEQSFERLGSGESTQVDVRIIAATNSNLREAVESGRFRRDLYFRLNVLPLGVPALRERPDDIPLLARHFLQRHNRGRESSIEGFSDEATERILTYSWPGNVRELENVVERAVVVARGRYIQREDLMLAGGGENDGDRYRGKSLRDAITMFKRTLIENSLAHHGWNQTATARTLGIQRTYLSRLIKELGIGR